MTECDRASLWCASIRVTLASIARLPSKCRRLPLPKFLLKLSLALALSSLLPPRLKVELTVPELVQTIILTRISGHTRVPDAEDLSALAAHQATLCLYLSARHVQAAQDKLMQHYPSDCPVAVCFRLGWQDEKLWVVPLSEMAAITERENLVRTTLYVISPALELAGNVGGSGFKGNRFKKNGGRSRLYNPDHAHIFRPKD